MTEPEPAANPQALTEDIGTELKRLLDKFLSGFDGEDDDDLNRIELRQFLWDNKVGICLALIRPAADRGQIVEECARVAEKRGKIMDHIQREKPYCDRPLTGEIVASHIAADIRGGALSPAPAQAAPSGMVEIRRAIFDEIVGRDLGDFRVIDKAHEAADRITRALGPVLASERGKAAEGWVWVPKVPTDEMKAAMTALEQGPPTRRWEWVWQTLLASAHAPAQTEDKS